MLKTKKKKIRQRETIDKAIIGRHYSLVLMDTSFVSYVDVAILLYCFKTDTVLSLTAFKLTCFNAVLF